MRARGWCLVGILVLAPTDGGAQALRIDAQQFLTFGDLFPGLPERVLRTDPVRSGQFQIQGRRNADIQLQFILPPSLTGLGASSLPVGFAADDGGISPGNSPANQTPFDPRLPYTVRIPQGGGPPRVQVSLGGTVTPGFAQQSGGYTGPIVLIVGYLDN